MATIWLRKNIKSTWYCSKRKCSTDQLGFVLLRLGVGAVGDRDAVVCSPRPSGTTLALSGFLELSRAPASPGVHSMRKALLALRFAADLEVLGGIYAA